MKPPVRSAQVAAPKANVVQRYTTLFAQTRSPARSGRRPSSPSRRISSVALACCSAIRFPPPLPGEVRDERDHERDLDREREHPPPRAPRQWLHMLGGRAVRRVLQLGKPPVELVLEPSPRLVRTTLTLRAHRHLPRLGRQNIRP